jgi:mycofactocin precursor
MSHPSSTTGTVSTPVDPRDTREPGAADDEMDVVELLVEEVSIDGMCGVY